MKTQRINKMDFQKIIDFIYEYKKVNPTITYKQFCEGIKDYEE